MVFSDASIRRADGTEWTVRGTLEALKTAIWRRRPVLGSIMEKHGGKNLFTYSRDFLDVNPSPGLDERKPELISIVRELVAERLDENVADSVARQLEKRPLVSTTDHHGPIQHPFFLNANIISALPYKEARDETLQNLVVFSFSSTSLNNASTFARGLLFHGGMNGSRNLIKLPIFLDREKMSVVYATRPFTSEDLDRAHAELDKKVQTNQVTAKRAYKVHAILQTHFGAENVLQADDANQQFTKINYMLWPTLFRNAQDVPNLIYVDIESVVRRLLLRHHLTKNTLIYRMMFDPAARTLFLKYFNNLHGAFSLENKSGSVLFWGIDAQGHRVRLMLHDAALQSEDGVLRFELTPEAISDALRNRKMYPSMALCYLMISLYYGMKCLGGFCQVHDLTVIKDAWGQLLTDLGETKEAEALAPVQTKELGGDGLVLAYTKTREDDIVPATGIDMILEEECDTSYEHFLALSKTVTLEEMMQPMLPEMYTVLYSAEERDPVLSCLLPDQIGKATGLQQKIMETVVRA
ncbi:hypothetical protein A3D88_02615 [Candidatus Peribacteria bacterium RIFCSPHIGHO2_02_FULL_52_16]|nr:MAG: hypothetical protein A2706_00440 [Candidatus Peribacteria bacterium RIFCSPHIGHO2_01_FULL_51_35]OGJ61655.1 MAG: hypothetical protein A3D88_02615 [Candidatus Peribacteria bacterium RIFCSPHIGHO2_02_FULL_52_16]